MDLLIVTDDTLPDGFADALALAESPHTATLQTLSDFLRSHDLRFNRANGRFVSQGFRQQKTSFRLINRVIEISRETCENLAVDGAAPSRGQVSQAYERILKRYRQPAQVKALYSTVGTLVPLFTQWRVVESGTPGINTPTYKYGYGPELIDAEGIDNPIYTTPFHLYDWRPNSPMEGLANDTFIIERPKGRPVVSFFCGDYVGIQALQHAEPLSSSVRSAIREGTIAIRRLFTGFTGELLWFAAETSLTFGAFSYAITASSRHQEYADLIVSALWDLESGAGVAAS